MTNHNYSITEFDTDEEEPSIPFERKFTKMTFSRWNLSGQTPMRRGRRSLIATSMRTTEEDDMYENLKKIVMDLQLKVASLERKVEYLTNGESSTSKSSPINNQTIHTPPPQPPFTPCPTRPPPVHPGWNNEADRYLVPDAGIRHRIDTKSPLVFESHSRESIHEAVQIETMQLEQSEFSSILILGGVHGEAKSDMFLLNSYTNTWQILPINLPYASCNHGAAVLNNEIYFIGGEMGVDGAFINRNFFKLLTNGYSFEWFKLQEMRARRSGVNGNCFELNGLIWVVGGYNERDYLNLVETYDPRTNSWNLEEHMIHKRLGSASVVIDKKIYVTGGWMGKKGYAEYVEVYDPSTETWSEFCKMPYSSSRHCAIADGSNLILIGGRKNGKASSNVWKLDVTDPTRTWKKLAPLSQPRCNFSVAKIKNKILVFGGKTNQTDPLNSTEIFDGQSWHPGPPLPKSLGNFASVALTQEVEETFTHKYYEITGVVRLPFKGSKNSS